MRRFWLLAAVAVSVAANASGINSDYRISGSSVAAPIQVFDDGAQMYIQLRDLSVVPAPIVDGVPVDYRIRGHYLVLPLFPQVDLRLGHEMARIERTGFAGGQQAKVFTTVDPLADIGLSQPPPPPPVPVAQAPAINHGRGPQAEVQGQIVLDGEEVSNPAVVTTTGTRREIPHGTTASQALPTASELRGKRIFIVADGTVGGARHAESIRSACAAAGGHCAIQFRGAGAGKTIVEIN